jgi:hypothetical protein
LVYASLPQRLARVGQSVFCGLWGRGRIQSITNVWITNILSACEASLSKIYPQAKKNKSRILNFFLLCMKKAW